MKALKLTAVIAAASMMAVSCGILTGGQQAAAPQQQATAQQPLTYNNGSNAGLALLSLYLQYKQDKKVDFTNPNNIVNLLTLTGNIKGLTPQSETAQLVSGLIAGSNNLVNTANSSSVVNSLTNLAAINTGNIQQVATQAAGNAATSLLTQLATAAAASTQANTTAAANAIAANSAAISAAASTPEAAAANSILTGIFGLLK